MPVFSFQDNISTNKASCQGKKNETEIARKSAKLNNRRELARKNRLSNRLWVRSREMELEEDAIGTNANLSFHQAKPKAILHLDVNCFYASVEQARLFPELEGKPVAVRQRSLLVTTNYIARERGVPKMCSVAKGLELVPDLVVIESDMSRYREANRFLLDILREFTKEIEKASIDEAFLDVTKLCRDMPEEDSYQGVLLGGKLDVNDEWDAMLMKASKIAHKIRMTVKEKMRLETSWYFYLFISISQYLNTSISHYHIISLSHHSLSHYLIISLLHYPVIFLVECLTTSALLKLLPECTNLQIKPLYHSAILKS